MAIDEQSYLEGRRRAYLAILQECLQSLGIDDVDAGRASWVIERQETVAKLRELCDEYGDLDWDDDLNLADVLAKHLAPYLGET
jgi:protein-disulfide isomerase-like protein with CxxC motif